MPKHIAIIGSTGVIGRQTLEVIRANPRRFSVFALACHKNTELLEEQIREFQPQFAAVFSRPHARKLTQKLAASKTGNKTKILAGREGWEKIAEQPRAGKIIFASSGLTAITALKKAIRAKKEIAIANKEMIVADGESIMKLAKRHGVEIVPIDSEHSAIFQCLRGEDNKNIEKIILTCSGGPFFGRNKAELQKVTAEQALRHPTWNMGKKISIDSATLMNKGFEIIEAKHLFGLKYEQIEILIHPECIVHSFVQFRDGSVKAQLAPPDMRLPITYALSYPQRISTAWPRLNMQDLRNLTFYPPDYSTFEGPTLALNALKKGRRHTQRLVKANDEAVSKFLAGEIDFPEIYSRIKKAIA